MTVSPFPVTMVRNPGCYEGERCCHVSHALINILATSDSQAAAFRKPKRSVANSTPRLPGSAPNRGDYVAQCPMLRSNINYETCT